MYIIHIYNIKGHNIYFDNLIINYSKINYVLIIL